MSATFTVPATAVYTNSETGKRVRYHEGDVVDIGLAVKFGMPGASLPAAGPPFNDAQVAYLASTFEGEGAFSLEGHTHAQETQARTATANGATTGTISVPASGSVVITPTSDDVDKIIVLPDASLGTVVILLPSATGYELRTHAPATVGISGGTGANAESAIAANMRGTLQRTTATNWVGHLTSADSTVTAIEAAA